MNLLVGILFLLIANNSNITMENRMSEANRSADLALASIHDAERSGADLSILIEKFNNALDLIKQANTSSYNGCFSYDNCLERAIAIFNSINKDSVLLEDEASRISIYRYASFLGIFLPLAAFCLLLFIFYLSMTWKSFQKKKFLNMKVKERMNK